jgi:TnpA family transposase
VSENYSFFSAEQHMPWKELLSLAQRAQVLALPTSLREYEEIYTLTPADREFVAAHRTNANRLGVAVQLCFLRYPGRAWTPEEVIPAAMVQFIARQVGADPDMISDYAGRDETRREHLAELIREYGYTTLSVRHYRSLFAWLTEQARGTDNGLALVMLLVDEVRRRRIVVPTRGAFSRPDSLRRLHRLRQDHHAAEQLA